MGMFDTIRCSYDLGPGFHNRDLQTKDIESLMLELWLDPAGKLWEIDYSGTHDFFFDSEEQNPLLSYKTVSNGSHGKVRPYYFTGDVIAYPCNWKVYYAAFPECKITFVRGIIDTFEHIDKKNAESMETLGESTRTERGIQ